MQLPRETHVKYELKNKFLVCTRAVSWGSRSNGSKWYKHIFMIVRFGWQEWKEALPILARKIWKRMDKSSSRPQIKMLPNHANIFLRISRHTNNRPLEVNRWSTGMTVRSWLAREERGITNSVDTIWTKMDESTSKTQIKMLQTMQTSFLDIRWYRQQSGSQYHKLIRRNYY